MRDALAYVAINAYKQAAEPACRRLRPPSPLIPAKRDATRYYQWVVENPSHEGFRARAYDDDSPKKLRTIGYGINLQDAGNLARLKALFGDAAVKGWLAGQPMTRAQSGRFVIDRVMNQDIPALRKALPGFDAMPALARLAMISARYNGPTLIGPKLCGYMAAKNYPAAVGELAYGHNSNLLGHARRRNLEAVMLGRAYGLEPTLTEQADPVKRALLYDQYMQGLQQTPAKE